MKKIKVYAHLEPEYMFEKGIEAGLSEEAADYFRFFEEVKLELLVGDDGAVLSCEVVGR